MKSFLLGLTVGVVTGMVFWPHKQVMNHLPVIDGPIPEGYDPQLICLVRKLIRSTVTTQ
jgi:hypothetical protein